MFERKSDKPNERAQVGIGTLIVFIAMVLVAAIAAGVLINTAGFLQTSAEESGQQAGEQVTDRVQVISETGHVDGSSIDSINLDVKKAPGAGDVDLSQATIQWIGPDGASDLTYDSGGASSGSNFGLSAISGSTTVLTDDSDVFTIELSETLGTGVSATVEITTASGGTTEARLTVPESLSGNSAVSL